MSKTVTETFEYDEQGRVKKKTVTTVEHQAPFVYPQPQPLSPPMWNPNRFTSPPGWWQNPIISNTTVVPPPVEPTLGVRLPLSEVFSRADRDFPMDAEFVNLSDEVADGNVVYGFFGPDSDQPA